MPKHLPWRRLLLGLAGVVCGLVFLWLAVGNADLPQAIAIFRSADVAWIMAGVGLFGVDFAFRIARWRGILAHRAVVEWRSVARALFVGYAMNSLLPARLGELFRADYLGRLSRLPRLGILAAIFVERLLDLIVVLLLLALGLALTGSENPTMMGVALTGGLAAGLGAIVVAVAVLDYPRRKARDFLLGLIERMRSAALAQRVLQAIRNFVHLLRVVGTRRFAGSILWTILIWSTEALAVYSICHAVHIVLTPVALITLLGGSCLSTLLPTAPGYIGSFQLSYVIVLQQFGVSETAALAAATAVQVYLIGVYTVLGLLIWISAMLYAAWRPAAKAGGARGSDAQRT